jgi:hypothetical protein
MSIRLLFAILGIITVAMFVTAWYMFPLTNMTQTITYMPVATTQTVVLAKLTHDKVRDVYWLNLNITIPQGYHIYSIYQEANGPPASTIDLDPNTMLLLMESDWFETPNPTIKRSDVWPGVKILQLEGVVDWTVPIRVFGSKSKPVISGVIKVYPCGKTGCLMPQKIQFTTEVK